MNPTTTVPVTHLPPGLPAVVMGDGTRCLIDNNTIWIPAGNPVNLSLDAGYLQSRLLQPGGQSSVTGTPLPPAVQPPSCSRSREMMPVCQLPVSLPSSVLDLELMRPEAFSCVLPQLDPPSPVPHPQSMAHLETPHMPSTSYPKPKKQKVELKPCKRKPRTFRPKPQPKPRILKEKMIKRQPESKPYFVPQPLVF